MACNAGFIARNIAKRRAPNSREAYESIGGGSPIVKLTQEQGDNLVGELKKRNLTSVVAQIFFHDDEIGDSAAIANSVRWLRENAPHITPQANTFSDAAPESLYQDGQFLFAPEQCKSDTLTICARSLAVLTRALLQMRSTAAARTRRR